MVVAVTSPSAVMEFLWNGIAFLKASFRMHYIGSAGLHACLRCHCLIIIDTMVLAVKSHYFFAAAFTLNLIELFAFFDNCCDFVNHLPCLHLIYSMFVNGQRGLWHGT